MARKLSISKDNYFKLGGLFPSVGKDVEWIKSYGKDGYQKMWEFIGFECYLLVKGTPDFRKEEWFDKFKDNPRKENLLNVIQDEKKTKVGKGLFIINELSAHVFYQLLQDIYNGKDLKDLIDESPWTGTLIQFYGNHRYDLYEKFIKTVDPTWFKPTKPFIEDVSGLIRGYEEFLKLSKRKKYSERELCNKIESKLDVSNVRDDFRKYNDYFKYMEEYVGQTLSPKFRISYLKACADPYL